LGFLPVHEFTTSLGHALEARELHRVSKGGLLMNVLLTKKAGISTLALATLLVATGNCPSFANFAQRHPRRAEVIRRDNNINRRINSAYGDLGGQYGHLENQDRQIYRQEQADARRNGGYITKAQQGQLNREENSLSRETFFDNKNNKFVQNHPRRSEVLSRDANLNYAINKDEGHLGGNYKTLEADDRSIAAQEQQDARANGGYITKQQQAQLNQEENGLRKLVNQDFNK
jgi:hypothetical protein